MNIHDQEESLFSKWKKERKNSKTTFVRDGVISEIDYLKPGPKIVFILKEVNSSDGKDWDLREYLRRGAPKGGSTWNNAARWVYGIKNRKSMPDWEDFQKITEKFREDTLKSICAINLKKKPGKGGANLKVLEKTARKDSQFIQQQYAIYDPDLTLCCGTGQLFKEVVGHCGKGWRKTRRNVSWYERAANKYVIDFFHPARPIESSLMLFSLIDTVNEIHEEFDV